MIDEQRLTEIELAIATDAGFHLGEDELPALVALAREAKRARREAIEEAAKVVDGFNENPDWIDWEWTRCAAAIRRLSPQHQEGK